MRQNSNDFDDWYQNHPNYYSQPSDGLIECLKEFGIGPCKAIDVGCGQGRNALWLASKGFEVVAVDNSPGAIGSLKNAAKAQGLQIDARVADIRSFDFGTRQFELVVILTTLNHLESEYIPDCCKRIIKSLTPNGVIYCVSFTTEDPGFKGNSRQSSECSGTVKYYFLPGELKQLFSDLEVMKYKEYTKADDTHGPLHYHGKVKLIGRKHE